MGDKELIYIKEAFDTNWIAPLGHNVDVFEEELARFVKVKHVAALSSGTAALHLALIVLGVSRGDEIIASTFTFSATINPIVYVGATPVLIDSEPKSWNMSPELLRKAINDRLSKGKKPKAIIPVHLYGMPSNMDEIMDIANQFDIPVIEDAAEALGSHYKNKSVGSFGKLAILSFNGNKIITTSGGGALLSNDEELIKSARFLASQARDEAPYYQHSKIGYNYRMSNVLAGIGRGQMEVIDERLMTRRENFFFYKETLEKYDSINLLKEPDDRFYSNHWLNAILINSKRKEVTPEQIKKELENDNIESRFLWKPMHLQPVFSSFPAYLNGVSEHLFKNGICIPSGSNMTEEDRHRVLSAILKCVSRPFFHLVKS
jgi:dTDP-4-amino-4,6-dideoxygalactose transaminase